MAPLTTDIGEEWLMEVAQDGASVTFLLYNDSTDTITETDDVGAITTEPTSGNYARQTDTVTTEQLTGTGGGDWGYDNDADVVFDVTNTTETVDAVGYLATFTSTVAGDSGDTEHLIAVDTLSETRDLSNYDEIEFPAGDLEHAITGT